MPHRKFCVCECGYFVAAIVLPSKLSFGIKLQSVHNMIVAEIAMKCPAAMTLQCFSVPYDRSFHVHSCSQSERVESKTGVANLCRLMRMLCMISRAQMKA